MRVWRSLVALVIFGSMPTTASAAVRYASSGGSGAEPCTAVAPCALADAVSNASNGDQVLLAAGDYTLSAPLTVTASVTIEGTPGQQRPKLNYTGPVNNTAIFINAPNVAVRRISVEGVVDTAFGFIRANGGLPGIVFDQVVLKNNGNERTLIANPVVVRDSLIVSSTTVADYAAVLATGSIVGSTIVADQGNTTAVAVDTGWFTGTGTLTVRNSILRGGTLADARVYDQSAPLTQIARIDVEYSLFGAGRITAVGSETEIVLGPGNVTGAPALLVNASLGADVHQQTASPTVDAGSAAAAAGSTGDFEGDPRIIGAAPDIGADEYVPAPTATTAAATEVTQTTATLNASINPNGRAVTYFFDFGTTASYGTTTTLGSISGFTTPQAGSATLTGLSPGTTYHFRVTATRSPDSVQGADLTFTTASAPAPPVPPGPPPPDRVAPSLSGLTLTPASVAAGKSASLALRLSEAGTIRVTIDRLVSGRKRGARCLTTARTGKRCTKAVRTGSVARSAAAGRATLVVPARLIRKKGTYRVTVVVTDAAGNAAKPQVKTLRVR